MGQMAQLPEAARLTRQGVVVFAGRDRKATGQGLMWTRGAPLIAFTQKRDV